MSILVLLAFLIAPLYSFAQQPVEISGVVSDSLGAVIAKAVIECQSARGKIRAASDNEGKFTISCANGDGVVLISAPGFMTTQLSISAASTQLPLAVRLQPANVMERITVAGPDSLISESPSGELSIPRRELEIAGALTVDDVLRQAPGFSLFRRSGGLFANPTSQGVSLRGIAASGASRSLVLLDGVPLNSPFGGWVYWNRVPRTSIDRMEVFNGAASDLYGSGSLGGVVNITTRNVDQSFLEVESSFGNESTPALSFDGGKQFGQWGIVVAGQALRTDGYIAVPENQRGKVDTPVGTADLVGSLTASRSLARNGRVYARLSSFGESRHNGTPLQINDTRISSADAGVDLPASGIGDLFFRIYGSKEIFNQNFSSIALDRNSESLTNRQRNPSQQFGLVIQWSRTIGGRHYVTAGFETRDVRGHSAETTFNNSITTARVDAGGRQGIVGVFGQDFVRLGKWEFSVGGRFDRWLESHGFSNRIPVIGAPALANFANRSETAFSPRVTAWRQFNGGVSLGVSVYRAFRAPTLNELYRNFRIGNVVTNANAALVAERLTGGEVGINWRSWRELLTTRASFFWSEVGDPIANVTLSSTPALITRQRRNLGAIRARGLEVSASLRITNHWQANVEYLLTDSTVLRFSANPALEGLWLPQIPRNQFNFQTSYSKGKWAAGVQGRFVGKQFDDDQNKLPLRKFFTLDAEASRSISSKVTLFVAVQNATGTRYETGSTPVITVGPPVLARLGARWTLR